MTEENPNTNCLAGMQCPECKSYGPFRISATSLFVMYDNGSDDYHDVEYDDGSYCDCPECDHAGIVHDFKTEEA